MRYDAIVLAGGAARRLGGVDKPGLRIGTRRLLDVALDAVVGADRTVVVGPTVSTGRPVTWTRESPPGGGPVAALAAGLGLVDAALVVVLAADLPFVTAAAVRDLVAAAASGSVVAVDADGRDQPLLACYHRIAMSAAVPPKPTDTSMRSLLRTLEAGATLTRLPLGGEPPVTSDCDTRQDLDRAAALTIAKETA